MGKNIADYQNQAKRLFKTLTATSPIKCSIESNEYLFHYIIEQDACFLTLCDRNFNKKLAYSFLEDLSQEFYSQYGHKINTATRPYSFIEFGKTFCFECLLTGLTRARAARPRDNVNKNIARFSERTP